MNLATLRIEGPATALEKLRNKLNLHVDSKWKAGDPRRGGQFHTSSGLSVTIADADNPHAMLLAIREFLKKCAARNIVLSEHELTGNLTLGLTVGDSVQFIASADFSAADLSALGTMGIGLSLTAYPTSDEANFDVS